MTKCNQAKNSILIRSHHSCAIILISVKVNSYCGFSLEAISYNI